MANGKMNLEDLAQAEYGPSTGIWRILRILKEHSVKATFLTCGVLREAVPGGHAGDRRPMGTRSPAMVIIMRWRGICRGSRKEATSAEATLRNVSAEDGKASRGVAHLHSEPEYLGDSPRTGVSLEQQLVSVRFTVRVGKLGPYADGDLRVRPYGDGWIYGGLNTAGDPIVALRVWKALFDELYQESACGAVRMPVCDASVHQAGLERRRSWPT